ncbi:putative clathrin assembly protein At1g25240 [Curcuma longa]|uniref:putative clathrin assembly protein At1g25240 n=1 Tax=Curcuma longa TaxID=136217 RepID=UPI003D9E1815
MTSPARLWWRRVMGTVKDKWSVYLVKTVGGRHYLRRRPEVDAAVIRATSHDEMSVDYKSAGRVFTWARAAPSSLMAPLMWAVGRRASRTRSWPVALKCLLLAHGLLLCSDDAPPSARVGRLPFDLSDFRGRSSASPGFSAFVRAYFNFLDHRSLFSSLGSTADLQDDDDDLEGLERLQVLLDLLMQIQPYADGMEVGLVLEAMDCVVIEIFEVYSGICSGIAQFLVGAHGSNSGDVDKRVKRRRAMGIRILRRAAAQSAQLSSYFDLCRSLGVLNAADLPRVEGIPEKDMNDIEVLMLGGAPAANTAAKAWAPEEQEEEEEGKRARAALDSATMISRKWVVFDDEGNVGNTTLLRSPEKSGQPAATLWSLTAKPGPTVGTLQYGNLIDL